MLFRRNKIQIDVYVNYGNDNVRHKKLVAEPGINALDALDGAADIDYTPDESATNHHGAMVTAIDGYKVDINHFWIIMSLRRTKLDGDYPFALQIY
ncbi:MAG: hypothetical protein ABR985_22390 [Methanotrichaceae archaeon]|jgi:hypothetical protein